MYRINMQSNVTNLNRSIHGPWDDKYTMLIYVNTSVDIFTCTPHTIISKAQEKVNYSNHSLHGNIAHFISFH